MHLVVVVQEYVEVNDPYEYGILLNGRRGQGLKDATWCLTAWHGGWTEGRLKLTELLHPKRSASRRTTASSRSSATR